jgi:carboxymethylenebutenolidase
MSQAELVKEKVELNVAGSSPMAAYVVRPTSAGPHPGLIVFQEAFGVTSHIRDVANRFAAEGYVVIAPELFHRTAPPGFEGDYKDFSLMMPHIKAVTTEAAEADIHATHDWLLSNSQVQQNKISSVGFCMGGRISFMANSVVPLRAAVSFYGSGIATGLLDRAARLHGPALLIWGGLDKHITADHRSAVASALTEQRKPHVSVVFSDADHAFFCDQRAAYKPDAARQAWALTLEFLRS